MYCTCTLCTGNLSSGCIHKMYSMYTYVHVQYMYIVLHFCQSIMFTCAVLPILLTVNANSELTVNANSELTVKLTELTVKLTELTVKLIIYPTWTLNHCFLDVHL